MAEIYDEAESYRKELCRLRSENAKLKEAIKNVPTNEYDEAQNDGCDSCGAWDCFLEALQEWKEQTLRGE
jgi:hypothetical protein